MRSARTAILRITARTKKLHALRVRNRVSVADAVMPWLACTYADKTALKFG